MKEHVFLCPGPFPLENGGELPAFELAYTTEGSLRYDAQGNPTNVVWVCHALTANAHASEWWPGLVGAGHYLDPSRYFIICVNILGSCYGSTNALSLNPQSGSPYFHSFPDLSIRDIVRALDLLREHLAIKQVHLVIGGSLGGQQALEWAIMRPNFIQNLCVIATNAQHSPWGIAFNESQRMAIAADGTWPKNHPEAGMKGLRAARALALLSYRTYQIYQESQGEVKEELSDQYRAASYQRYQGDKLAARFHAFAYWSLSMAMDSHDVGRARGGIALALSRIKARTMIISISSDILFPSSEQKLLHQHIPLAQLEVIDSVYGHDGFLIEVEQLEAILKKWLENPKP